MAGRRRLSVRWAVVLLLVIAFAARVAVVAATPNYRARYDAADYDRYAWSIASGHGYPRSLVAPDAGPTAGRPPGYPYFLASVYAVAGRHITPARYVQAIFGTLTVALIAAICFELWGIGVALVAMAVAAVYPASILLSASLLSESLSIPLMLAAVWAALRYRRAHAHWRWVVAAGILCGLSTLTRASSGLLLVPLAIAVVGVKGDPRWRKRLLPVIALVTAFVLTCLPWTIRNAVVMKHLVPISTEAGVAVAGTYNDTTRTDPAYPSQWRPPWKIPQYGYLYWRPRYAATAERLGGLPAWYPRAWRTNLSEVDIDHRLLSASLTYVRHHPLYPFRTALLNAGQFVHLRGGGYAGVAFEEPEAHDIGVYGFFVVAILALGGIVTRRPRQAPAFLWLIPVLFLLTCFLTGFTRFRGPIDPFLVMLAALGIVAGASRVANLNRPARSLPGAA